MSTFLTGSIIKDFIGIADEQKTGQGITKKATDFTRKIRREADNLIVQVSFGIGRASDIPWIAFTGYEQYVQKGIYPVYLYYKKHKTLVLAYGVSETNPPSHHWLNEEELLSITEYFKRQRFPKPRRYGSSYVYEVYDLSQPLDLSQMQVDLDKLIEEYHMHWLTPEELNKIRNISHTYSYDLQHALDELFISEAKLQSILRALEHKKNIILQGPPGTGKTFIARRLAYLKLARKDASRVQMIQFHQSYAYEDFIQGYRPTEDGKFELKNGVFYEFCRKAQQDPGNDYFFIIDEINRGNLGKVFGELMLLIENDKRGDEFSMPLTYSRTPEHTFYIPANVYLVGTMNTADRSLAMVDYALRRRFAFINIEPELGPKFIQYLAAKGVPASLARHIADRITELNQLIHADNNLGRGFAIGHSYFCGDSTVYDEAWYNAIIENEISPLLTEYWFEDEQKADKHFKNLLA